MPDYTIMIGYCRAQSSQNISLTQSCKTALLNIAGHPETSIRLNMQVIINSVVDSNKA
jgi:hypothetical protein